MRDPQDDMPRFHCDRCGGEVYEHDSFFRYNGKAICSDCAHDWDFWQEEYDPSELIAQFLDKEVA